MIFKTSLFKNNITRTFMNIVNTFFTNTVPKINNSFFSTKKFLNLFSGVGQNI